MTINEAIELVDKLKPNQYEHEIKVHWLGKIDGMIFTEIIKTHERTDCHTGDVGHRFAMTGETDRHSRCAHRLRNDSEGEESDCRVENFHGYDDADPDTELLVKFPYDEDIYNYFLQACIDKENGEMNKYNQSITLFNAAYKAFQDWYNRTHMPLPKRSAFRF